MAARRIHYVHAPLRRGAVAAPLLGPLNQERKPAPVGRHVRQSPTACGRQPSTVGTVAVYDVDMRGSALRVARMALENDAAPVRHPLSRSVRSVVVREVVELATVDTDDDNG